MKHKNSILICLAFFFVLVFSSLVSSATYYELDLQFNHEKVSISQPNLIYSRIPPLNPEPGEFDSYRFEMIDNSGKVIYIENITILGFDYYENLTNDENSNSEFVFLDNFNYKVYLPYNKDATEIKIYDKNNNILAREEIEFISLQNQKAAIDTHVTKQLNKTVNKLIYFILIIILLILAAIGFYFYFNKNKK